MGYAVVEVKVTEAVLIVLSVGDAGNQEGEVGAYGMAGDGAVGVLNVGGAVSPCGVSVEEELEEMAGGHAAIGGGAKLVVGFKAGAMLAVEGTGEEAGELAAGGGMTAKRAEGLYFGQGDG